MSPIKCSETCIVTLSTAQINDNLELNLQKNENKSNDVQNNVRKCTIRKIIVTDIPYIFRKYPEIIKHLNIWYTDLTSRVLKAKQKFEIFSDMFLNLFLF